MAHGEEDGGAVSRLMVGTAQFGMPYGVANRAGPPDADEARAIVAAALEGGVNAFDTAAAYGRSEEVLGRTLCALGVADRVVVVTKVCPLAAEESADPARAARAIERSVEASRRRLGLDRLPVVLFHREADARHLDVLERLRDRGWLERVGVSCDNRPGGAAGLVAGGRMAALQLPANLLDHRHRLSGVFVRAAGRGVAVYIRSVYLQGVLAMAEEALPPLLRGVVPARRRLAALAAEAGLGLAEMALRYMLAQEGVASVLVGVETAAQMRENLERFARGPLPADLVAALDAAPPDLPERLITPSLWPTA